MKQLFFDLETTGLNFLEHGIHQISGIFVQDGVELEKFNFTVKPASHKKIDPASLAIAGKTLDQINAYPAMAEVFSQFVNILNRYIDRYNKEDKAFLVGYNNASFDNDFLRAWFADNNDKFFGSWFWSNSLDVMVLATQKLSSKRSQMNDFKLSTVCTFAGIGIDSAKLHDALYDVELTKQLYDFCTTNQN